MRRAILLFLVFIAVLGASWFAFRQRPLEPDTRSLLAQSNQEPGLGSSTKPISPAQPTTNRLPVSEPPRNAKTPLHAEPENPAALPASMIAEDGPLVRVFGVVTAGTSGEPISGARVGDSAAFELEAQVDKIRMQASEAAKNAGVPVDSAAFDHFPKPSISDVEGRYEMTVSASFLREIRCVANGYAPVAKAIPEGKSGEYQVDFALYRGGSIAGHVTERDSGNTVADVEVVAELSDSAQSSPFEDAVATASTDSEGGFTLVDVPAGNVRVRVNARDRGYVQDGEGVAVTVHSEEVVDNINVRVYTGGHVDGVIRDGDNNPIEDVSISVEPVGDRSTPFVMSVVRDFTERGTTDKDGKFAINGIDLSIPIRLNAQTMKHGIISSEPFTMTPDNPTHTVDLQYENGATVSGIARLEDGSPAGHTSIHLTPKGQGFQFDIAGMRMANSEFDGSFEIGDVADGHYLLASDLQFGVSSGNDGVVEVVIENGADVSGLELVVKKDRPGSQRIHFGFGADETPIAGVVLGQDGRPAGGIAVSVQSTQFPIDLDGATTDAEGKFSFGVPANDSYTVKARSRAGDAVAANVSPGDTITLQLSPPTILRGTVLDHVELPIPGARMSLIKESSGVGSAADAIARSVGGMENAMGGTENVSDARGNFEFLGVDPGDYVVKASAPGHGIGRSETVSIRQGNTREGVIVRIAKSGLFAGLVTNKPGAAVPSAEIQLHELPEGPDSRVDIENGNAIHFGSTAIATAVTDSNGTFNVDGLTPGTYVLAVKHVEYSPFMDAHVVVAESGSSNYKAVLTRGGAIRGLCLKRGAPRPKMTVTLTGEMGTRSSLTDVDGKFSFDRVAPGTYSIDVYDMNAMFAASANASTSNSMGDGWQTMRDLQIEDGKTLEVTIGGGVTVSGVVHGDLTRSILVLLREGGIPDTRAFNLRSILSPEMMQGVIGMAKVSSDGTFTFEDIEPGPYSLETYIFGNSFEIPDAIADLDSSALPETSVTFMEKVFKRVEAQGLQVEVTIPGGEATAN